MSVLFPQGEIGSCLACIECSDHFGMGAPLDAGQLRIEFVQQGAHLESSTFAYIVPSCQQDVESRNYFLDFILQFEIIEIILQLILKTKVEFTGEYDQVLYSLNGQGLKFI